MARKPTKARKANGRKALGPLADVVLPPPPTEDVTTFGMPSDRGVTLPDPDQPLPDPAAGMPDAMPIEVELESDTPTDPMLLESGAMEIPLPDGGVEIDFDPRPEVEEIEHDGNLATVLDTLALSRIADDLVDGIDADDNSRAQWLQDRARGIELLGLKLEDPRSGATSAPVEGMSVIRHPMLLDAVLRFQANARGELLPAKGPVKVVNEGRETQEADQQADVLEELMNYYLTTTATEYYPDTNRLLFEVGFSGCAFKKVYFCPIRRRPVSETIFAKDLIVSNDATDLDNAARVTHRLDMRPSVVKRMQLLGVYRNVDLGQAQSMPDPIKMAVASVQGIQADTSRPEDQQYEILECYCELDIPGYEHMGDDGEPTGLPLPYRVTLERTSKQILEIRRNWKEGDPDFRRQLNIVKYSYADGMGFYSIGLLHIMGNATAAATASWRIMLDSGMFSNFPGGVMAKQMGRQMDNNLRVGPGEWKQIDTQGMPIQQALMPMPYKGPDQALMALNENIVQTGSRAGGSADIAVGEGKQDAPVGTTLALLEGQQKIMSAVHRNLHTSQKREFELLVEEFKKDPEVLWRSNKRALQYFDIQSFLAALENFSLVPCSDPNVPSQMHRMAKMQAMYQIASAAPMLFNLVEVAREMLQEIGFNDPDRFFAPQQPPQPDPMQQLMQMEAQTKAAQTQIKGQEVQIKAAKTQHDMKTADEKMKLEYDKAILDLAQTIARYPQSNQLVDQQLVQTPMLLAQQRSLGYPPVVRRRNGRPQSPMQLGLGFN